MANTTLGFTYPDDDDPVDVPLSVRELAESLNTYFTPQLSSIELIAPFLGGLNLIRVGPIVIMTGGILRAGWTGGSTQVASLPAGAAPAAGVPSIIGSTRAGDGSYQVSVQPDGRVMFQLSAASNNVNGVSLAWGVA